MIKKTKLFGIFFSATTVFPSCLLATSCGKKNGSDTSLNHSENDYKLTISEEIKNSIKDGMVPKDDKDLPIVVIKDLVNTKDIRTQKTESDNIERSLYQMAFKLNKNSDEAIVKLESNSIVESALKKIISDNCKTTSNLLKSNFSSEFGEVATDSILEIDEDGLFFNLKKFGMDKILRDIGYDENDGIDKINANSQALKIYKFTTDLKIIVNANGGKKAQFPINNLSLFVVSSKEQTMILREGLTEYLQNKFKDPISLFLDGDEKGGKSDIEMNRYFKELLDQRNYNLNEDLRKKAQFYLADKYLPELIYKNANQAIETYNQKPLIKIDNKILVFDQNKDNFRNEQGMTLKNGLETEMNFLNFFNDSKNPNKITPEIVEKITPELFLNDPNTYHDGKYYKLGSGTFKVSSWSIRGFPIKAINAKVDLFINCEILKKEILNLHTCLINLLKEMNAAESDKTDNDLKITFTKEGLLSSTVVTQITNWGASQLDASKLEELNKILTSLFTGPAKDNSEGNINKEILGKISFGFKFEYATANTDVYFIFNNSFKIKLSGTKLFNHIKVALK